MENAKKTRAELIALCKAQGKKGYSGKTRAELVSLFESEEDPLPILQNTMISESSSNHRESFVYQTMLTCIGNKRKLVTHIRKIVEEVAQLLNKPRLNIVDGFAGSSVVSRELSYLAENIYSNDLELYSYLMAQCYLVTPTAEKQSIIRAHIDKMNCIAEAGPFTEGIISRLYAPKDTDHIQKGERCFYTRENALIIDTLRQYITDCVEPELATYCLVPLLNKASIHTNTAGVFKGFYKKDDVGCFGGKGEFALSRIKKPIRLDMPVWNTETNFVAHCSNRDINAWIEDLPDTIDLMYLDPPYNQHPYGSNYFMLNIIAKNEEPAEISNVSGIPANWNKSNYNKHSTAVDSMRHLISTGLRKSRYLLISYNNEGILREADWAVLFAPYTIKKYELTYDTFKGCRNLKDRSDKVVEIMYLVSMRP
jgi:adenine-specific DNA-methyltransferase